MKGRAGGRSRNNKNKTLTGVPLNFEIAKRNVESEVPAFNRGGVWDREGKEQSERGGRGRNRAGSKGLRSIWMLVFFAFYFSKSPANTRAVVLGAIDASQGACVA